MAPKGMKRPAAVGVESAKKRVKPVVAGLEAAGGEFPSAMLVSMLEFSLGEFKEKRTTMQNEAVEMIGEALTGAEKTLEAKVEEAQKKCDGARADKDDRIKAEAAAQEALDGLKAAVEAAIGEEKKVTEEENKAAAALKEAEAEQKSGDKQYNATAAKKEKMEAAQAEAYNPLLKQEQALKETEIKKMLKSLISLGKECSFDPSLLDSAPAALSKKPADRGDFDTTILKHMDAQFQKCLEALSSEIQALEPGKQDRETKVNEAKAASDAIQTKKDAAKLAVKDAKEALKAGEKTLKSATLSVKNWLTDVKAMFDVLESATADLESFRAEPKQTYVQLKDMETPLPPPEEETEDPEPAADKEEPEPVAAAGEEPKPMATEDAAAVEVAVA